MLSGMLPVQLMAADAVGVLTNSGTVLIDSHQTGFGTAVFSGETVETRANSKAVITGKCRTISLGENSTIRFADRDIDLFSGAVVIGATCNFGMNVDGARIITDPNSPSKFLARRVGDDVQVVALEGVVYVEDGQQTTPVPATRGVNIGGSKKKDKKKGADYPGARKPTWLNNDDIGLLIVIAAGIAAGVTLGIINAQNHQPATPAGP